MRITSSEANIVKYDMLSNRVNTMESVDHISLQILNPQR
jgi:hypothetical protein